MFDFPTKKRKGVKLTLTPVDLPDIQRYSSLLTKFLHEFQWLIDAFVLDFFLKDHWSLLPSPWRDVLGDVSIPQVADFIEGKPTFKKVSPLSFLCFLKLCKTLPLSRTSIIESPVEAEMDNYPWADTKYPLTSAFKRHMKGKKRHEISRLARLATGTFEDAKVHHVLDVGGGQGHLSRLLCFGYGLNVATLDAVGTLVDKAQEYDGKVTKDFGRLKYREKVVRSVFIPPVHLEREIGVATASEDVAYVTKNAWNDDILNFGLIGLHTCGDLGPTMVKLFRESPQVKAIVSVGCCYHKIHHLYPISETLRAEKLTYEAKEVACHSIEVYVTKLREEDAEKGKIHSFRSALELLIDKHCPQLKHSSLSSVKYVPGLTFLEYAPKALKKVAHTIPEEEFRSVEVQRHISTWRHVATFFGLRLCIAPAIESLLIMDRIMYLLEASINVDLVPLFEPTVSPRCHVIVAKKT